MKSLYEAIISAGGRNGGCVTKHLEKSGIRDWSDCTKVALTEFVNDLEGRVCQASAHTYTAILKGVLNRYSESGLIPCKDIPQALKCKNEKCQKTYLTQDELRRLESVPTKGDTERFVKLCFLISAKTGMRVSDTRGVSRENVTDGILKYVSKKTSIEAQVPVSDKVLQWIDEVNGFTHQPDTSTYDRVIKTLCQRARINERVKVFRAGKESVKEKWQCVGSHTARVSFCTILANLGESLTDICTAAGHTNPVMTANYVVRTTPNFKSAARSFLND